jgi:hypothetical protein
MTPTAGTIIRSTIQTLLLDFDGVLPVNVGGLHDVPLEPWKKRQRLIELEQRTDVVFLVRHARRFFADLIILLWGGKFLKRQGKRRTASAGI